MTAVSPSNEIRLGGYTLPDVMSAVKAKPADPLLRAGLFRFFSVLGQWPRAATQLQTMASLDAEQALYASTYQACLDCERFRDDVFAAKRSPLFAGEPAEWMALLLQAAQTPQSAGCAPLIERAFELAPTVSGALDGRRFEWIADADSRFGPIVEAFIDGKYYWIPFERLAELRLEAPAEVIDRIWQPCEFVFSSGGSKNGFIPTRYPGSPADEDTAIVLAQANRASALSDDYQTLRGLRVFDTDAISVSLAEMRHVRLDPVAEA